MWDLNIHSKIAAKGQKQHKRTDPHKYMGGS